MQSNFSHYSSSDRSHNFWLTTCCFRSFSISASINSNSISVQFFCIRLRLFIYPLFMNVWITSALLHRRDHLRISAKSSHPYLLICKYTYIYECFQFFRHLQLSPLYLHIIEWVPEARKPYSRKYNQRQHNSKQNKSKKWKSRGS